MFMKIHRSRDTSDVVAVCDRELINTTITSGTMTVTISEWFYGNAPVTEEDVKAALQRAGNVNLMGERTISLAINMGLITTDDCIMIGKIPHVQVYCL
ncbi:MAG: DUF424 domain-containing protein [Methanoregula sp.]|jgi:uncharacterized protein